MIGRDCKCGSCFCCAAAAVVAEHDARLFAGVYPTGIVYADRKRERYGDYARLAFLSFDTLELEIEPDCPQELRQRIIDEAARIQARSGEQFEVSTAGQTVLLGRAINNPIRR